MRGTLGRSLHGAPEYLPSADVYARGTMSTQREWTFLFTYLWPSPSVVFHKVHVSSEYCLSLVNASLAIQINAYRIKSNEVCVATAVLLTTQPSTCHDKLGRLRAEDELYCKAQSACIY